MFVHPQLKFNIKNLLLFFKPISEQKLKNKLNEFFPDYDIVFTNSGRSAFQIAIKNLNLENSEMLVPAYICDIFLPIFKHYNIKPIFLDIDSRTFNVLVSEIESKITPHTKSILVCHTYGLPVEMDKILEIAQKYNLKVIEDCAHIFPSTSSGQVLGGDCAFFSLPKFLPVVNGGMLIFGKTLLGKLSLRSEQKFTPKISDLVKFLRLFSSLSILLEKFRPEGKTLATKTFSVPQKASKNSLKMLNWYLDNYEKQHEKRVELAKYFQDELNKIGFQISPGITYISALVPKNINRDELFNKLRKKNIFCSRIWHKPIYPHLPNTAEVANRIINFPLQNWFTKKDIDKIISCILSSIG